LNVVPVQIPPLRDRREDIPELVAHFLNYYSEQNDRYVVHIQRDAIDALQKYHWPGNVRELQNYVERAVVMAEGDELTVDLLPDVVLGRSTPRLGRAKATDLDTLTYEVVQHGLSTASADEDNLHTKIVNRVEKELIAQVMAATGGVQTKAAQKLGINRNTLHKKLKEYNMEGSDEGGE